MVAEWKPSTTVAAHPVPGPPDSHYSYSPHRPPQYQLHHPPQHLAHPPPPPPPPRSFPPPPPPPQQLPPGSSAAAAHSHPPLPLQHPPPFAGRSNPYEDSSQPPPTPDGIKQQQNSSPVQQYGPGPEPRHDSPDQRFDSRPRRRRSSPPRPKAEDASALNHPRTYTNGRSPPELDSSPRPPPSAAEPPHAHRDMEYHHQASYQPSLGDRMREQHQHHHMHPPMAHGHPPHPPHIDTTISAAYGPPSHPQSAPPYGSQPYSYGGYDNSADASQKRKAVRASQACDNCRAKKAKCDENRPCGNCANQNIPCHFRDQPAPKQERSMMQISDQVITLNQRMQTMENLLQKIASTVDSNISSPSGDRTSRERFITPDGYVSSQTAPAMSKHHTGPPASYRTLDNRSDPPNGASPHWDQMEPTHRHFQYLVNGQPRAADQRHLNPINYTEDGQPQFDEDVHDSELSREVARRGQDAHEDMLSKDYLNGSVALAPRHQTAANHLIDWPKIATFFGDIADRNYVKRGEFHHDLDLHQRATRKFDRALSTPGGSPMAAGTGENDDASTISNNSDSRPSLAFVRQGAEGSRGTHCTPGGRNSRDQSLSIDSETSFRLFESYIARIHILQPFLNKARARSLVQEFVNSYYFEPTFTSSPMEHSTSHGPGANSKRRKYNHNPTSQNKTPGGKVPVARTVENALVLLIFALGKVCEHDGPLPSLVGEQKVIPRGIPVPEGVICTPSQKHPNMVETRHVKFAEESAARGDQHGNDPYSIDIDRIPGLAYYVHAAQILGERHGENSLTQVHARLLAGLYLGQLFRLNESWQWIKGACDAWQMLFKQRDEILGNLNPDEKAAFWACLMLESDILAEHDCIPSGLSKWEDAFTANDDTLLKMDINDTDEEERYCFYVQGIIRSILNRAHSALYVANEDKEETSEWQKLSSEDYMKQLERWRSNLPQYLGWADYEGPTDIINRARLRGKYWGARYVICRPYLRQILDPSFQSTKDYDDNEHQAQHADKANSIQYAYQCLEAAKKSTLAFDSIPGMRKRLIVTNPFGTAQAQFSNVMVMSAAYCAEPLRGFIQEEELLFYIDRTKEFLSNCAHLSPTMNTDIRILDNTRQIVIARKREDTDTQVPNGMSHSAPVSANNSFYTAS